MVFFIFGIIFLVTFITRDRVEICTLAATATTLSQGRVTWLGYLDESVDVFFKGDVVRVSVSRCVSRGVFFCIFVF